MTRRARSACRLVLAAALLYGSGAHWLMIQGAAWAGMVAARAGHGSVARALQTTFDGLHPCRVCLLVRRGGEDSPSKRAPSIPTADFALTVPPACVAPAPGSRFAAVAPLRFASIPLVPPTPPPDAVRAA